ncbi:YkyB family protein [Virgibacillus kimchii]
MTLTKFVKWAKVPDHTKTQLINNFRLKPKNSNEPDAFVRVMQYHGWRDSNLYHINNTVKIRKYTKQEICSFELSEDNIAKALYVINKSAKKSRDTKVRNYNNMKHGHAQIAKERQLNLYYLKDRVLSKLLKEEKLKVIGYHVQESVWDGSKSYLLLYELEGFKFHIPVESGDVLEYKKLGEIHSVISAETKIKVDIKFNESTSLLEEYLAA